MADNRDIEKEQVGASEPGQSAVESADVASVRPDSQEMSSGPSDEAQAPTVEAEVQAAADVQAPAAEAQAQAQTQAATDASGPAPGKPRSGGKGRGKGKGKRPRKGAKGKKAGKKRRGPKISTIIAVLILVVGIGIIAYPTFSDWWNSYHQSRAIASYVAAVQ